MELLLYALIASDPFEQIADVTIVLLFFSIAVILAEIFREQPKDLEEIVRKRKIDATQWGSYE